MSKMSLQEFKNLFVSTKVSGPLHVSKHAKGKIKLTDKQLRAMKAAKRHKK